MTGQSSFTHAVGYKITNRGGRWVASGSVGVTAQSDEDAQALAERVVWASFHGRRAGKSLRLSVRALR